MESAVTAAAAIHGVMYNTQLVEESLTEVVPSYVTVTLVADPHLNCTIDEVPTLEPEDTVSSAVNSQFHIMQAIQNAMGLQLTMVDESRKRRKTEFRVLVRQPSHTNKR